MKISTKGRYGLRAMLELAIGFGNGPVMVETIAANQGISGKYIHNLMMGLKSAGLVRAIRGPKGGYVLSRQPSRITALDVIESLEGKILLADCVANTGSCARAERCAAQDVWKDAAAAMKNVFSGVTLEELATKQQKKQPIHVMYHI
ncbi:MAG: Rrf2 family transcriptional regulator [bacterium]